MFRLASQFKITSAQQAAVTRIVDLYRQGRERQVLLGVTGSGKTFVMANIIKELGCSCLVLSPNKTLAAQLYQEFKGFFPEDRVGYFISYYDYYQPEAYVPQRHLYIAKEVSINPEIERLRIDAARALLETEQCIVVASVSAIYNIGSPDDFFKQKMTYTVSSPIERSDLLKEFVSLGYSRTEHFMEMGRFRVRGGAVELFPSSEENPIRFIVDQNRLVAIEVFDALTGDSLKTPTAVDIYPISYFHFNRERVDRVIPLIRAELEERLAVFIGQGEPEYAGRLKERTLYDLEILQQYGYCSGIENYSYYLSGRRKGEPPYTLLDFFKGDFLTVIDESHITVPQLGGMYRGDRSRKTTLVNYGFRLPTAIENRPLNFAELNRKLKNVLYVSATPAHYELNDSPAGLTSLLVRPTGLVDPEIELRYASSPVEDMVAEINKELESGDNRILITTLTRKMAEKLSDYLSLKGIACTYLHAEIKALDRIKVIKRLRLGEVRVLLGINLLREGLDIPEVSLVMILDADRQGFLRSATSLIQTFGRASRNARGRVLLYLREMTDSIRAAVEESNRRREYQLRYNRAHGITPMSIHKQIKDFYDDDYWIKKSEQEMIADFNTRESLEKEIARLTGQMKERAGELEFKAAARLRERIKTLKNLVLELY